VIVSWKWHKINIDPVEVVPDVLFQTVPFPMTLRGPETSLQHQKATESNMLHVLPTKPCKIIVKLCMSEDLYCHIPLEVLFKFI